MESPELAAGSCDGDKDGGSTTVEPDDRHRPGGGGGPGWRPRVWPVWGVAPRRESGERNTFHGRPRTFRDGQAVRGSCQEPRATTGTIRPGCVQITSCGRRPGGQGEDRGNGGVERLHAVRQERPRVATA